MHLDARCTHAGHRSCFGTWRWHFPCLSAPGCGVRVAEPVHHVFPRASGWSRSCKSVKLVPRDNVSEIPYHKRHALQKIWDGDCYLRLRPCPFSGVYQIIEDYMLRRRASALYTTFLASFQLHLLMSTSLLAADYPLIPPPPGRISNFANPDTHTDVTIIICSVAFAFMMSFVSLRIYARLWVARTFSIDDCKSCPASQGSHGNLGNKILQVFASRPW